MNESDIKQYIKKNINGLISNSFSGISQVASKDITVKTGERTSARITITCPDESSAQNVKNMIKNTVIRGLNLSSASNMVDANHTKVCIIMFVDPRAIQNYMASGNHKIRRAHVTELPVKRDIFELLKNIALFIIAAIVILITLFPKLLRSII